MIKVFSSPDVDEVIEVREILEHHGIAAHVSNENTSRLAGTLFNRTPSAWPCVYVLDPSKYEAAMTLVHEYETRSRRPEIVSSGSPPWTCKSCGEMNDDTFEFCWKCGVDR